MKLFFSSWIYIKYQLIKIIFKKYFDNISHGSIWTIGVFSTEEYENVFQFHVRFKIFGKKFLKKRKMTSKIEIEKQVVQIIFYINCPPTLEIHFIFTPTPLVFPDPDPTLYLYSICLDYVKIFLRIIFLKFFTKLF